jgi:hypothetical protein
MSTGPRSLRFSSLADHRPEQLSRSALLWRGTRARHLQRRAPHRRDHALPSRFPTPGFLPSKCCRHPRMAQGSPGMRSPVPRRRMSCTFECSSWFFDPGLSQDTLRRLYLHRLPAVPRIGHNTRLPGMYVVSVTAFSAIKYPTGSFDHYLKFFTRPAAIPAAHLSPSYVPARTLLRCTFPPCGPSTRLRPFGQLDSHHAVTTAPPPTPALGRRRARRRWFPAAIR